MERVFHGLAPLDREDALLRVARPLADWNWSVSGARVPGASSNEHAAGSVWVPWTLGGTGAATTARELARLDGWRPDSLALSRGARRRLVRALWRSDDLNVVLEMRRLRRVDADRSAGWPLPPLFDEPIWSSRARVGGVRCSTLRWAYYELESDAGRFRVVVPPGRSDPERDRRLLSQLELALDASRAPGKLAGGSPRSRRTTVRSN